MTTSGGHSIAHHRWTDGRPAATPGVSREVTHTDCGPVEVTPEDLDPEYGDVAVCLCGLSERDPFCDGSHRQAEDERPDRRYRYVDGERRVVEAIEYADGTVERLAVDAGEGERQDATDDGRDPGDGRGPGDESDNV